MNALFWVMIFLMAATAVVLVWGLAHMIRSNGIVDAKKSNRLMNWRWKLQGLALIAFCLFAYFAAQ